MDIKRSKSKLRTLQIDIELWEAAKKKAGMIPLSAIIRALLKMWVNGEIEVKYTND